MAMLVCAAACLAEPELTVSSPAVVETDIGTVDLVFDVTLSEAAGGTVSVDYETKDLTTEAGADYTAKTGTLEFTPGEVAQEIRVEIIGDQLQEGDELLKLEITSAVGVASEDSSWGSQFDLQHPQPVADHMFGGALGLDGDTLVVGTRIGGTAPEGTNGSAWIYGRSLRTGAFEAITPLGSSASGSFGRSVAISGDLAVVGDPDQETVFVFERNRGGPNRWGSLVELQPHDDGDVGESVAVDGDTVVIGAPGVGHVYVYRRLANGAWAQQGAALTPSGGSGEIQFGYRVALDGDRLVASGLSSETGTPSNVFLFERDGNGVWQQRAELAPAPTPPVGSFGAALAIEGDSVCVGAPAALDGGGIATGAAYVFDKDAGGPDTWGLVDTLYPPAGGDGIEFGKSVALAGDRAVVGADQFGGIGAETGALFVFRRNAGVWSYDERITPSDAAVGGRFGEAVAFDGRTIVSGSPGYGAGALPQAGRVTLLEPIAGYGLIIDDEVAVSATCLVKREEDSGSSPAHLDISLDRVSGAAIEVSYATRSGSAVAGSDFLPVSGTATIPPGSPGVRVPIEVIGDSLPEPDETFFVDLVVLGIGDLARPTLEVTIPDDEPTIEIEATDALVLEPENGTADGKIFVSRTGSTATPLEIVYSTRADTAEADADYLSMAGSLNLATGEDSGVLAVRVYSDPLEELTESFGLKLEATNGRLTSDAWAPVGGSLGLQLDAGVVRTAEWMAVADNRQDQNITLYRLQDDQWVEHKSIPMSGLYPADYYHLPLVMDGHTLAIGAPVEKVVHIHHRDHGGADNWGRVATLHGDPIGQGDFGTVVGLCGDVIIVNSSAISGPGGRGDRIFVYERHRGGHNAWGLAAALRPPHDEVRFGSVAAVTDGWIFVSVDGPASLNRSGAVIAYRRQEPGGSQNWAQSQLLFTPELRPDERFGSGIAADGDQLAILTNPVSDDQPGRVLIFGLDDTGERWEFRHDILPPDGELPFAFGWWVEMERDLLVVSGGAADSGSPRVESTFVFRRGPGADAPWSHSTTLSHPRYTATSPKLVAVGGSQVSILKETSNRVSTFEREMAEVTIADSDVLVRIADRIFLEPEELGPSTASLDISLTELLPMDITVELVFTPGTAVAGTDYAVPSTTVVIPAGEPRAAIEFELIGDAITEAEETFTIEIAGASFGQVGNGTATITIFDSPPALRVQAPELREGDPEGGRFVLSLSKPSDLAASCNYRVGEFAGTGIDIVPVSGTANFPPGVTEFEFPVFATDDIFPEPVEEAFLIFDSASGLTVRGGLERARILDDDGLQFSVVDSAASLDPDSGGSVPFTISLLTPPQFEIAVNYSVRDLTTDGSEYTTLSGTATFAPGEQEVVVEIPLNPEASFEGERTFELVLSDPTAGSIGTATATGTISNDAPRGIRFGVAAVDEGDAGNGMAVIPVTLSHTPAQDIRFEYWTIDSTASAGTDFTETLGEILIPAGERSAAIEIPVLGDLEPEAEEMFFVAARAIDTGPFAVINSGVVIVREDDNDGEVVITAAAAPDTPEGDSGLREAVFPLAIDPAPSTEIILPYSIYPKGATPGTDYLESPAVSIAIPAGATAAEIRVPVAGDLFVEDDEEFALQLHPPPGVSTLPQFTDPRLTALGGVSAFASVPATDGTTLLIGKYLQAGSETGSIVEVYSRSSQETGWQLETIFETPSGLSGEYFGRGLAVGGNTFVVGAYQASTFGVESGDAYLFERTAPGSPWGFVSTLSPPGLAPRDRYGRSVAIEGDRLIVTAGPPANTSTNPGALYVYSRDAGSWTLDEKIGSSDGVPGDGFGRAVEISGNYAIVGAPYRGDFGGSSGAAYVFEWRDGRWQEVAKLQSPTPQAGAQFGLDVDIDGDWAAVSAPYRDDRASQAGVVYLFHRHYGPGGTWGLVERLADPTPNARDYFGYTLDLDDGRLLVAQATQGLPHLYTRPADQFTGWEGVAIETGPRLFVTMHGDVMAAGGGGERSAQIIEDGGVRATIVDDDGGLPLLSIDDLLIDEGPTGTTTISVTVRATGYVVEPISVNYTLLGATATPGEDFDSGSGTLIIPPLATRNTFTIDILGDEVGEADELFYIRLSDPQNANLSRSLIPATIRDEDGPPGAVPLMPIGAAAWVKVPTDDTEFASWREVGFDHSAWQTGTGGVGYERSSSNTYDPHFEIDVESSMYDSNETVYIRFPFVVGDRDLVETLQLDIKYDDGFIAYLNGDLVAERNAPADPETLSWDSGATNIHADSLATEFEEIDISAHLGSLLTGDNVLAIHGLNRGETSSDFLISPRLLSVESTLLEHQTWAQGWGLDPASLATSDQDLDTLSDLLEYALALHPFEVDVAGASSPIATEALALALEFEIPEPARSDVLYEVQVSPDLDGDGWVTLSSKRGRDPWVGAGAVEVEAIADTGLASVNAYSIFQNGVPLQRFMRLKVTLLTD